MAQRISGLGSERSANKLNLSKKKLATEKRVIRPERQEQLNKMLLNAARLGKTKRVERLLKAGADVNAKENDGWTALMHAARKGNTETCALLLEKDAKIDARSKNDRTALMIAAELGRTETCKLLLERNADIEAKDKDGWTALIWTARFGHTETEKFLKGMESLHRLHRLIGKESFKEFLSNFRECVSS